jgi:hypothetical protein
VNWQAILAGIGAILSAAGGTALVVREFRRRDRRSANRQIEELGDEVSMLSNDLAACRRWAFGTMTRLADQGIEVQAPPQLHHIEEAEGEGVHRGRSALRPVRSLRDRSGGGDDPTSSG